MIPQTAIYPWLGPPTAGYIIGLSYEIWSAAQLGPGEGMEDGRARVAAILREQLFAHYEVTK